MARRIPKLFPGSAGDTRRHVEIGYFPETSPDKPRAIAVLHFDDLQWIISRTNAQFGKFWAEMFPTSKRMLLVHCREMGIELSDDGRAFIDGLADYFPGSPGDRRARWG